MVNYIYQNFNLITLIFTFCLVLITLYYAIVTHRSVNLSSHPCLLFNDIKITITPDVYGDEETQKLKPKGESKRVRVNIFYKLSNIGNNPAQDVFIDSIVCFKTNKPLNNKWLPIDKPQHISFLGPHENIGDDSKGLYHVCFDGFCATEIINDFFLSEDNYTGLPLLLTEKELKNKIFWPSPLVILRCYYKDIQKINYCSEYRFFLHVYLDEFKKLCIYPLHFVGINFLGIKHISSRIRDKYLKNTRHLRYISFWGKEFNKNDLVTMATDGDRNLLLTLWRKGKQKALKL